MKYIPALILLGLAGAAETQNDKASTKEAANYQRLTAKLNGLKLPSLFDLLHMYTHKYSGFWNLSLTSDEQTDLNSKVRSFRKQPSNNHLTAFNYMRTNGPIECRYAAFFAFSVLDECRSLAANFPAKTTYDTAKTEKLRKLLAKVSGKSRYSLNDFLRSVVKVKANLTSSIATAACSEFAQNSVGNSRRNIFKSLLDGANTTLDTLVTKAKAAVAASNARAQAKKNNKAKKTTP